MAPLVRRASVLVLITAGLAAAQLHEPFMHGYAMGTLGTIVTDDGPGGSVPMKNAVTIATDSSRFGTTASVISYYDDMDDPDNYRLVSVALGGWYTVRRFAFNAAVSNFDAFGIYREQSGYFSGAISTLWGIRIGADITGTRLSLAPAASTAPLTLAQAGFSIRIPVSIVAIVASVDHLTLKDAPGSGAAPPLRASISLHTMEHTYGAQGIRVDITPDHEHPVRVALGQEFHFSRNVAIHGALAANPFLIGMGVTVGWRRAGASASLVNHPVLGWSRGFGAHYRQTVPSRSAAPGNNTAPAGR